MSEALGREGSESPRAGCVFAQAGDLSQQILDRTSRKSGHLGTLSSAALFHRDLRVSGERQVSEVHKEEMFNHPQRQREQGSPEVRVRGGDQRCVWPGTTGHAWGPDPLPGAWGPFCLHTKSTRWSGETSQEVNPLGPTSQSTAGLILPASCAAQTDWGPTHRGGLSGCAALAGAGPKCGRNELHPRENAAEIQQKLSFRGWRGCPVTDCVSGETGERKGESRGERQKEGETGRAERDGG